MIYVYWIAFTAFMVQLGINFAWCFVFFRLRMFLAASLLLAVMLVVVVMMFAGYLGLGVYFLNV